MPVIAVFSLAYPLERGHPHRPRRLKTLSFQAFEFDENIPRLTLKSIRVCLPGNPRVSRRIAIRLMRQT